MFKPKPLKPVLLAIGFKLFYSLKTIARDTFRRGYASNGIAVGSLKTPRVTRGIALVLFVITTLTAVGILVAKPTTAAATTSSYLNFQARLETSNGAIAADGEYNVEFKLYDADVGGSLLWTEDHLNSASQGVRVVNGYLTVSLGSVTGFGSLDWNQQIWLTLNIGDTTSCTISTDFDTDCSGDGEMSPRLQLTAVPYAFQAGALGNGANRVSLDSSGNLVFQQASTVKELSGTSGTALTIQGGQSTGSGNNGGSLVLQGGAATGGGGAVSGSVIVRSNGTNSASAFQIQNSSTAPILTVDTTNSKVILGQTGGSGINGQLVFNSATASNYTVTLVASGSQAATYSLTLPTSSPSTSQCLKTDATIASQLTFAACGGGGGGTLASDYTSGSSTADQTLLLTNADGGGIILKDDATPITGSLFAVQNNAGSSKYLDIRSNGFDLLGAGNSTISTSSGSLQLQGTGATSLKTANGTASSNITLQTGDASAGSSGSIILDVGTATGTKGSINIGNNNPTDMINIGAVGTTANATTVNIANTSGSATQVVNIGATNSANNAILIQGGTSSSAISLQTGASGTINIGTNNTANTIQIGSTTLNGGTQAIGLGNNNTAGGTTDVAIGSGTSATGGTTTITGKTAVNITGYGSSTWQTSGAALSIVGGTTLSLQSTSSNALSIDSGTTGAINIATGANNKTIQIGATNSAVTDLVYIGNNTNVSGVSTIVIGSTKSSSTTTIQGGTGNINLQTDSSSAGTIVKTITNSATAFVVQDTGNNSVFGVDTSAQQVLFGKAGTYGGKLVMYSGTASNTQTVTITTGNTSASYSLVLPTTISGHNGECLSVGVSGTVGTLGFSSCSGASLGTQTVTLIPEFVGATFSEYDAGTGTKSGNNTGFMTSDHAKVASGEFYKHNYYEWYTDNSSTAQDYHIVTEYQLPSNWNATNNFASFKVYSYLADNSGTNSDMVLQIYDTDGTACYSTPPTLRPSANITWELLTLTNPQSGGGSCSFAADDIITIDIKMVSKYSSANKPARLGEIQFTYTP